MRLELPWKHLVGVALSNLLYVERVVVMIGGFSNFANHMTPLAHEGGLCLLLVRLLLIEGRTLASASIEGLVSGLVILGTKEDVLDKLVASLSLFLYSPLPKSVLCCKTHF